ncbi:MAG: protein-L-isoaspartate(D-aspartate) O-methyltransferase [Alphaproteobacteria bacterium]
MSEPANKIRLLMELRRAGITDTEVLSAIERVPREAFIPEAFQDRAYEDTALPIARGQTISQPYVVAYMTAALEVKSRMRVLEIGTGSGYQAAVLSHLARRVFTIERQRDLLIEAEKLFERLRLTNITVRYGDGFKGWPEAAPFDRIIVTAAAPEIPSALVDQLGDEGGIMIVPVGASGNQTVLKLVKNGEQVETQSLLPVRFVPMLKGTES